MRNGDGGCPPSALPGPGPTPPLDRAHRDIRQRRQQPPTRWSQPRSFLLVLADVGKGWTPSKRVVWVVTSMPSKSLMTPRRVGVRPSPREAVGLRSVQEMDRAGNGTYFASKVFTRMLLNRSLRNEQHRLLAEYLALFFHPTL